MFGEHELKTQFIRVGDKKIHLLEESEGLVRYRRDDVERILKNNGEKLRVLPAPATGYGVKLLMVRFKESLVVPPHDSITGFIEAPVEVDVKIGGLVVDHFLLGREKYALYGTLEAGVICRYHVGSFYPEEPESIGIAKLIVSNPTPEWKALERVVIPIWKTPMYYESSRAYYPLLIVTIRDNVPYVSNTGKPPKDGLNAVGEGLSLPNFLMRW